MTRTEWRKYRRAWGRRAREARRRHEEFLRDYAAWARANPMEATARLHAHKGKRLLDARSHETLLDDDYTMEGH